MDVCRVEFFYNLISIYTNLFITCIFAYKNTFCNVDLFAHLVKLFICVSLTNLFAMPNYLFAL